MVTLHQGDSMAILPTLPEASANCCVTSPPYWALRDYAIPPTIWPASSYVPMSGCPAVSVPAWTGCLGLEPTPELYVAHMVQAFAQVWRVLRPDGTLWLNLGDIYITSGGSGQPGASSARPGRRHTQPPLLSSPPPGMKAKDLAGIPWRVAFALQAAGWFLRADAVWHKTNPMPESCKDRPTKAHEYVFLLARSRKYYFDRAAVAEPVSGTAHARRAWKTPDGWDTSVGGLGHGSFHRAGREAGRTGYQHKRAPGVGPKAQDAQDGRNNQSFAASVTGLVTKRNIRTVWTMRTEAYKGAHYATFPRALARRCILAGCPPHGVVIDPFGGTGTVGEVAESCERNSVLIETSETYMGMMRVRTGQPGLFNTAGKEVTE